MSNLLNLKGVKFFAIIVLAVALLATFGVAVQQADAASCTITVTLRLGSTGAEVACLQAALGGLTADGKFGPKTQAAVIAFQRAHNLTPDGVFGPMSRAAWMGTGVAGLPAGCQPGWLLNPITGTSCAPTSGGGGGLSGGAGDATISSTSTDVEDSLKEGEEDVKVLGLKVEAEDSDIKVTSLKVSIMNCEGDDDCIDGDTYSPTSSENLEKYLDEVTVWMGDKKVGSADASDFTRDSGSPDEFTKSISLSGATVRDNDEEKFYIAFSAVSTIDQDDRDTASLHVVVESLRFEDATGAILTSDVDESNDVSFDDASEDDQVDIKSSSNNPDDDTIDIDEDDNSDETLALVFKLDVDEDSSDVIVNSLPITLTVSAGGSDADSIENIVDEVVVKVDGDEFDADLDDADDDVTNGTGTAVYTVDFDDDEFTIESGDAPEVEVWITFNDQEGNYADNTVITASVDPDDIDAETDEDEVDVGGSTKEGAELTLSLSSAGVSGISWVKTESDLTGTIDFFFTVEADDEDFDVLATDVIDDVTGGAFDACTASSTVKCTNGTGVEGGGLTRVSGDDADSISGGFTVAEGDTVRFRVRYITTTGGSHEVTITSVAGDPVDDDDQLSPTVTID